LANKDYLVEVVGIIMVEVLREFQATGRQIAEVFASST